MKRAKFNSNNTVVINATNIGYKFHGIGVYSLNILKEFTRLCTELNFIVYLNKSCKLHIQEINFPNNFKVKWVSSIISPDKNFKGHLLRLIYSNFLSLKHWKHLLFNTSQLEINFFRKNQVVTIHDVIPLLFKEYHRKQYPYFKIILTYGLKYAKYVLTPSKHSKDLLQQIYNLSDERIKFIHNGSNTIGLHKRDSDNEPEKKYILYIGRINKIKNIKNLLKAYSSIGDKIDHNLVIVGDNKTNLQREMKCAGLSAEIKKRVIFKQDIDEESKCALMMNASLLVFASLYEGFGLPPLEAMACGCPVIVSDNSSLPEVCGEAAYYVNPQNPSDIVEGIIKVLNNSTLRNELINNGLERAKQFSWTNSAKEHLNVLEHVIIHSSLPLEKKLNNYLPILEEKISAISLEGINS
jgi:glycosyltransferase involved in cell wall biosynthesis